ncbi:MAG: restriction endonuclease subunit S, partial [Bacteroides sp.]|nr:restriction endonuclease subunit S [Bacteroides sp.]
MSNIEEIIDIKNGKITPKSDGQYPIYGGNGIIGFSDQFNYENIVIIGRVGANCGSIHIAKGKCWVSDNALAGLPKNQNTLFNYYLLKSLKLNSLQIGSSQPLLTQGILNKISIHFPKEQSIQKNIASVLSSLDDKIENNNRINAELEAMAKTIYEYWFVQFDFPDANGKPYKSSGGKMVYSEELKREIPEGWKVGKITEWIASDKSGDWGKENAEGNHTLKVSCIRGADINGLNGKGNLNPPQRYILEKNRFKLLNPHDLIIEISGGSPTQSTGRMTYITEEMLTRFKDPLICSNFCKAITLKNELYLYNFAFLWNMLYN